MISSFVGKIFVLRIQARKPRIFCSLKITRYTLGVRYMYHNYNMSVHACILRDRDTKTLATVECTVLLQRVTDFAAIKE